MNLDSSRRVMTGLMACGMAFLFAACNEVNPVAATPPPPAPPAPAAAPHQSDMVQVWSIKAAEAYNPAPSDPADTTKTDVERHWPPRSSPTSSRHWPRNLAQFSHWPGTTAGTAAFSLAEDARLSAMVWVSLSDTLVACWDAKFHYWFWRPHSAIPLADTDGNDATVATPAWAALGPVPPHPEYPTAHTCVASAVAETLASYFDTRRLQMTWLRLFSPTSIPGQSLFISQSLYSSSPGRSANSSKALNSLGVSLTGVPSCRQTPRRRVSRMNPSNS
jgi:hypothetical protein